MVLDRDAVDPYLAARCRREDPAQDAHQGRLAGTVLADQAVDLAAAALEVAPAQRVDAVEGAPDPAHGEERRRRAARLPLADQGRARHVLVRRAFRLPPGR